MTTVADTTLTSPTLDRVRPVLVPWVLANTLGFGLIGALFHNVPIAYAWPPRPLSVGAFSLGAALFGGVAFGAVPGLLVGWRQQRALCPNLPVSRGWWATTAAGVGLMHALVDGFEQAADHVGAVLVFGLAMGFPQWRLLRRVVPRVGWWAPVTLASIGVGWALGIAVLASLHWIRVPWAPGLDVRQHGLLGVTVGAAYGVATGLPLARQMAQRDRVHAIGG